MKRLFAIGDIHGQATALQGLLDWIAPSVEDTLVFLGDYINRGLQSREVVDTLIALAAQYKCIMLLGNHEEQLLAAKSNKAEFRRFLDSMENNFFSSYGDVETLSIVPLSHWEFFRQLKDLHVEDRFVFVHANYEPNQEWVDQSPQWLRWESIDDSPPTAHFSNSIVIVGHSPQKDGKLRTLITAFASTLDAGWEVD